MNPIAAVASVLALLLVGTRAHALIVADSPDDICAPASA